jgi:hypothetical protein
VEELKLGLDGAKLMVGFQWLARFDQSPWVCCQKFHRGVSCLISSIANSGGAFMVGVGHEEVQQFGLFNP